MFLTSPSLNSSGAAVVWSCEGVRGSDLGLLLLACRYLSAALHGPTNEVNKIHNHSINTTINSEEKQTYANERSRFFCSFCLPKMMYHRAFLYIQEHFCVYVFTNKYTQITFADFRVRFKRRKVRSVAFLSPLNSKQSLLLFINKVTIQ